jgi:phage gp36-like protein
MSSYATIAEFYIHGIRAAALTANVTEQQIAEQIEAASGKADSYLRGRFRWPLSSWGVDITQAVCQIAAYELVASQIGFNPEAGHNMVLGDRKESALAWLHLVSIGKVTPAGVVDSTPSAGPGGPSSQARAFSRRPRGW